MGRKRRQPGQGQGRAETLQAWPKVNKDAPNGCWEWTAGQRGNGYGVFNAGNNASVYAHRFSYELLVGPIPENRPLDHLCRNTICVNPEHLEPVTSRENNLRGISPPAENARKTHCVNGHEFTLENTGADKGRRCLACKRERYHRNKP